MVARATDNFRRPDGPVTVEHMPGPSVLIVGRGSPDSGWRSSCGRAGLDSSSPSWRRPRDLGGVWRDNTYPGAACDIPSPLTRSPTGPNPTGRCGSRAQRTSTRTCARVAEEHGLPGPAVRRRGDRRRVRRAAGRWPVTTGAGELLERGRSGARRRPARPVRPAGHSRHRRRFAGPAFHSAAWDHAWT